MFCSSLPTDMFSYRHPNLFSSKNFISPRWVQFKARGVVVHRHKTSQHVNNKSVFAKDEYRSNKDQIKLNMLNEIFTVTGDIRER